tara:strand:+ start:2315 stop:2638 length:324 start_codon:yes stop_codon:yes gene_type:complete
LLSKNSGVAFKMAAPHLTPENRMKRLIEEVQGEGLEKLIGEKVTLLCSNYFYTGKLVGVNTDDILLKGAYIIYETGHWSDKNYKDQQKVCDELYIRTGAIEAFGVIK